MEGPKDSRPHSERIQITLASSHKNIEVFEKVAYQICDLGYSCSATECRTKTKALHADYHIVVSHNKEMGRAPATCLFLKELHAILHGDGSALSVFQKQCLSKTVRAIPTTFPFPAYLQP